MKRTIFLPILLSIGAIFLLASCGGNSNASAKPQTPGEMVRKSLLALNGQKSAFYSLDTSVQVAGPDADKSGFGNSLSAHLEGGLSKDAITTTATAKAKDKTYNAQLLLDKHSLYLKFMGEWFGDKSTGIANLESSVKQQANKKKPGLLDQLRALNKAEDIANKVLSGSVSEGENNTWVFKGTLNASGIEQVAKEEGGKALTDKEKQQLRVVADVTSFSFSINKDNSLPHTISIDIAIDKAHADRLKALGGTSSTSIKGIDSATLHLSLTLDKWGQKVSFEAPGQFKPLNSIFGG